MVASIPRITKQLYEKYEEGLRFNERILDAIQRVRDTNELAESVILGISGIASKAGALKIGEGEHRFFAKNTLDIWEQELINTGFLNYGLLYWVSHGDLPTIKKGHIDEYTKRFSHPDEIISHSIEQVAPRIRRENEGLFDYHEYRAGIARFNTHQFMARGIPEGLRTRISDATFESALVVQAHLYDLLQTSSE